MPELRSFGGQIEEVKMLFEPAQETQIRISGDPRRYRVPGGLSLHLNIGDGVFGVCRDEAAGVSVVVDTIWRQGGIAPGASTFSDEEKAAFLRRHGI